jgi:hypothetical protein
MDIWGWDRYQRTWWTNETGAKLYIGFFRKDNDPYHWTLERVEFWAHKPIVAMREICRQCTQDEHKLPRDFYHKVVN